VYLSQRAADSSAYHSDGCTVLMRLVGLRRSVWPRVAPRGRFHMRRTPRRASDGSRLWHYQHPTHCGDQERRDEGDEYHHLLPCARGIYLSHGFIWCGGISFIFLVFHWSYFSFSFTFCLLPRSCFASSVTSFVRPVVVVVLYVVTTFRY
jgi:hypothetical protein